MTNRIRWGILGTGSIAHKFATGLAVLPDAELVAVGSRTQASADAFADPFNVPHRHASYDALAADPDVEVVYVATPHPLHHPNTVLCLKAGKAVLCEKPFAINAREAEDMVRVARERRLFLMEAMWTRYLPIVVKVREWLAEGRIGRPRMMTGDFGFRAGFNEESRLFDRTMGGGALLDVGIYPISFASMVFGRQPSRIAGFADLGKSGVDEQAAIVFSYDQGELATLYTAIRTTTPQEVIIMGEEGSIRIHSPFWYGTTATLAVAGKDPETVELPYLGNGYTHEAMEVMRCLRAGEVESPVMPLDETIALMKTLDAIRAQWGLTYPTD